MFVDFRSTGAASGWEADVCIIGAGAAGIALATSLMDTRLKIVIVESGSLDLEQEPQGLSRGDTEGFRFTGLTEGRARAFGGATRLWAGQCIRLDPMDFAAREWVPFSGWPIGPQELDPYYARAEQFMDLDRPVYGDQVWDDFGIDKPDFDPREVVPRFTIYCRNPDFKEVHGPRFKGSRHVTTLLNATAIALRANGDGAAVDHVEIGSLNGRRGVVRARAIVLCGGGIENARILLASRDIIKSGLKSADLVGRFFQDHPSIRAARIATPDPQRLQERFAILHRSGLKYWPKLALSPSRQRDQRVLNANAYPVADYEPSSVASSLKRIASDVSERRIAWRMIPDLMRIGANSPGLFRQFLRFRGRGVQPVFWPSALWLQVFTEQTPDPDNRVTLSDTLDPLGVPRARVSWKLGELERKTFLAATEAIGREFSRLGLGRLEVAEVFDGDAALLAGRVQDSFHHSGTTKMSSQAAQGVVDVNCRVHGVSNLYAAGGSVMPTAGYANPTLTIIALALRLSEHLRTKLTSSI